MARYYTYKSQVPLGPGESLGFTSGKGYYAISAPAPKSSAPANKNPDAPVQPRVPPPPPIAPPAVPTTGTGRGTPGAGAGLGGAYAPPGTPTPTGGPDAGGHYPPPPASGDGGDGGGGGGGGGGGSQTPAAPDIDWANVYFGSYGLPADLIAQIEALGKKYGTTNPDVFFQSAQNLIRGSDWFKTTFPGFAAGVTAGLFTDETGYRGYVNNLNTIYQQYLGRHVSGDETAAALAQGATPGLIGQQFQGDAIAKANGGQWQYATGAFDENGALTPAEQTAYGREQAGIDTPLGQMVAKRVQLASARAQALFGGTLAAPSLSLTQGRLSAPSLSGNAASPDIAA